MQAQGRAEDRSFQLLLEKVADVVADKVIGRLKPEINKLLSERVSAAPSPIARGSSAAAPRPHGSLWSVDDIAKDSGTSPSTWRKWILQRRIPSVRLGRSVRIKDSDYRKLIEQSFTPELDWNRPKWPR